MNNNISTDENPTSIVISIFLLYILIEGFFFYLYLLHRIDFLTFIVCSIFLIIFYIPRFKILKKILKKDVIRVDETSITINNKEIFLSKIQDFRIEEKKAKVLFFFNNKMVVYKEAIFYLKLENGIEEFTVIGSKKIELLKQYLLILSEK